MGGNLGLFVGISIITVLEFLDYILDVILILISPSLYHFTHRPRGMPSNTPVSMEKENYCEFLILKSYVLGISKKHIYSVIVYTSNF